MKLRAAFLLVLAPLACRHAATQPNEGTAADDPRPNILFILADDLGWGDVGYHGGRARTPTLDRLAREGVELDQHYVTPQCSPTRTALLTGRYPSRFDTLMATNAPAFPADTTTLARALQEAGYHTMAVGKWHLGLTAGHRPWEQGFAQSYGALAGAVHPWQHTYRKGPHERTWHRNGQRKDESGENATELITREAERLLSARAGATQPWFLYMAHFAVHAPVDAPDAFKRAYEGESLDPDPALAEDMRRYLAFASQLDDSVARVIEALRRTGQLERTLVVFASDNGAITLSDHDGVGAAYGEPEIASRWLGSNGALRGAKASTYEGGIRTPAFVSFPGRLRPLKVTAPIHIVDWFPTLLRLAQKPPPNSLSLDGVDVWGLLSGAQQAQTRTLYWKYGHGMGALRHGDWKLVIRGESSFARQRMPGDDPRTDQLFNLAGDPGESTDLAPHHPAKVAELRALMRANAASDQLGRLYGPGDPSHWVP